MPLRSTRTATLAALTVAAVGRGGPSGTDGTGPGTDGSTSTSTPSTGTGTDSTGESDAGETTTETGTEEDSGESDTGVPTGRLFTYIGGYSGTFQWAQLDPADGSPFGAGQIDAGSNPSFLAVNPARTHLHAVDEIADFDGNPTGAVAAFEID